MISVIIAFRIPPAQDCPADAIEIINSIFDYWKEKKKEFGIDLVLINDHSEDFWMDDQHIYPMPGEKTDWNQSAARNYGATKAQGDKFLFTDIDHVIHGDFNLLDSYSLNKTYLKFHRVAVSGKKHESIKPHINTFLLNKADFIGYDETFKGHYGHEDTDLFFRLRQTHCRVMVPFEVANAYVFKLPSTKLNKDASLNKARFLKKTNGVYIAGEY